MITTEDRPKTVVTGDMPVLDSRVMGIRAEALAAITESMVNLYTDKHLAVIREYSTNARDAMVAAGNADQPIVVSLPDVYDPQLVVTDTGLGMSMTEVLDFYAQYGASDKRETNDQVGSFGYGCKSAFTIADHFTVTADKDGSRTVAVLYRNNEGLGTVDVVYHGPTDQPNGVSVAVPISDPVAMEETARRFFKTWEPGTVLVDGEQPHSVLADALRLGPVYYVRRPSVEARNGFAAYVLMGGVTYPMHGTDGRAWARFTSQGDIYLTVDIGAVDIVPSREGLRDTTRTGTLLTNRMQQFETALIEHVRAQVEQAPSWFDAARTYADWRPLLAFSKTPSLTWQGQPVTHTVTYEDQLTLYAFRPVGRKATVNRIQRVSGIGIGIEAMPKILLLTGMPDENAPIRHLARYCAAEQIDYVIPSTRTRITQAWFDTASYPNIVRADYATWAAEVDAARKAELATQRSANGPANSKVSYDVYGHKEWDLKRLRDFPGAIHYVPPSRYGRYHWLRPTDDQRVLVMLRSGQQADVFARRVPAARPWRQLVDQLVTEKIDGYTAEQVKQLAHARAHAQNRHAFDKTDKLVAVLRKRSRKLLDPELRRYVSRTRAPLTAEAQRLHDEFQNWSRLDGVGDCDPFTQFILKLDAVSFGSPLAERYPLLNEISYWRYEDLADQLVHYLNGVYAAEQSSADVA